MKKFVVPVILAAVLGIGGGVTAVMINRANTGSANDDVYRAPAEIPEVKAGTYYLDNDKNSEVWLEVTPDFLIVKGNDIDKTLTGLYEKQYENDGLELTSETLAAQLTADKELFCVEKAYILEYIGTKDMPYIIQVSRHDDNKSGEELKRSNAGFRYNDETNTIHISPFGDFILVEE